MPRLALVPALVALAFAAAFAQEPVVGLEKTAQALKHTPSKTEFALPAKWTVLPPQALSGGGVSVGLKRDDPAIEVTLYWASLAGPLDDFVRLKPDPKTKSYGREHEALKLLYEDKVGKPEQIKVGERSIFRILIDDGPLRDGKLAGVLYLFEAGPDAKNRWRIKMRATYPKMKQEEHQKVVEALLGNYK